MYKVQFCRRSPVRSPVQNLYGDKDERRVLPVIVFFLYNFCQLVSVDFCTDDFIHMFKVFSCKKPVEGEAWDKSAFTTKWTVNYKLI